MPLVFVHGIADRESEKSDKAAGLRDALFRTCLLDRWRNGASFPIGTEQALGGSVDPGGLVEAVASDERLTDLDRLLVDTAKALFADGVDLTPPTHMGGSDDFVMPGSD